MVFFVEDCVLIKKNVDAEKDIGHTVLKCIAESLDKIWTLSVKEKYICLTFCLLAVQTVTRL